MKSLNSIYTTHVIILRHLNLMYKLNMNVERGSKTVQTMNDDVMN